MTTTFTVSGPFEVPIRRRRNGFRAINTRRRVISSFWEDCVGKKLSGKNGCYVFAVQAGPAIIPWYVGRTTSQTFALECFAGQKPLRYDEALGNYRACTPLLFLLESSSALAKTQIKKLEQFLIELAAAVNPKIQQTKGIPRPSWVIPGVTQSNGKGGVADAVLKFRDAFNLERPKGIKTKKKKRAQKGS